MLDDRMNFAQASVEDILYYLPNDDILKSISQYIFSNHGIFREFSNQYVHPWSFNYTFLIKLPEKLSLITIFSF